MWKQNIKNKLYIDCNTVGDRCTGDFKDLLQNLNFSLASLTIYNDTSTPIYFKVLPQS